MNSEAIDSICATIVVIIFILATQTKFFDNLFKKKG